jgi:D-alanyl-D-alanine carboxypeptidase
MMARMRRLRDQGQFPPFNEGNTRHYLHWADNETLWNMLPVAGVDGSLTERFRGTPAQGRVHGKTGSLKNVNALSGYATTLRGERIAYSIMVNNHNLTSRVALQTIDQIANALIEEAK